MFGAKKALLLVLISFVLTVALPVVFAEEHQVNPDILKAEGFVKGIPKSTYLVMNRFYNDFLAWNTKHNNSQFAHILSQYRARLDDLKAYAESLEKVRGFTDKSPEMRGLMEHIVGVNESFFALIAIVIKSDK